MPQILSQLSAPPEALSDHPVFWLLMMAVVAMAAVVGVFWKIISGTNKELKEDYKEVLKERESDRKTILDVSTKVAAVEGKIQFAEGLHPKVDAVHDLISDVLVAVTTDK